VKEVFEMKHMLSLQGSCGIAHNRYPTAGTSSTAEAQPFYTNSPFGLALAHNGNLTNQKELDTALQNSRHINTDSDSELLLNIFADELAQQRIPMDGQNPLYSDLKRIPLDELKAEHIFAAVTKVMAKCRGGYAVVVMINGVGILAFRDKFGIRPCAYGTRESKTMPGKQDYCIASESVVMDLLAFTEMKDVQPGEAVFIDQRGESSVLHTSMCITDAKLCPCIFEHVYMARPDSTIDGVSVYQARLNMGESLGESILAKFPDNDIDVVIPIPDTSRTSALQCAYKLNVPYREGFIKNRYIARTFIMPGQLIREKNVRLKLNPIKSEFSGKVVLLVDDSIVRGTTSKQLVRIAREAGAKKVYIASAAPAIRYPNVYGIDMPSKNELIAHNRDEAGVAEKIGADRVFYQELEALEASVKILNPNIQGFDCSVFNGIYLTGDIDEQYHARNDALRSDDQKKKKNEAANADIIDMYNSK